MVETERAGANKRLPDPNDEPRTLNVQNGRHTLAQFMLSCHLGTSAVALMNLDDTGSHQLSTRMEAFTLLPNEIQVSTASPSLSASSLLLFQTGWSTAWTQTAALKSPARVRPTVADRPTPSPSPARVRVQPSRPRPGAFTTASAS